MSGGHFDYQQYRIEDIATEIEHLIESNDNQSLNEYGDKRGREYSQETIAKFKEAVVMLRCAAEAAQRIDWLVSGDDGEDDFHSRWDEGMARLNFPYT